MILVFIQQYNHRSKKSQKSKVRDNLEKKQSETTKTDIIRSSKQENKTNRCAMHYSHKFNYLRYVCLLKQQHD